MSDQIPTKYDHKEVEKRWMKAWEEAGIYRWDPTKTREETFVVDTPPPTISGSLHMGHIFSYTHQDLFVRFHRMMGKNISYPMGWDDNGLPTERRVQNVFNIRCNPNLPYVPNWEPQRIDPKKDERIPATEVSRQNFIEACALLVNEDEKSFQELWTHLGLSLDWSRTYATIDDHCRHISQLSFLDLVDKGEVYNTESPTMWDVDFKSAVAQAEVEDKEIPGAFYDIRFGIEEEGGVGGEFTISTTRPELLPACVAVVAHPTDDRYKKYFGKFAITPLFKARVPILAAEHADPEKGSGILMVCTFGDIMDVEWWKKSSLPAKQIISLKGTIKDLEYGQAPFESIDPKLANENYKKLVGLDVKKARKAIAELLAQPGSAVTGSVSGNEAALIGEPKPITHPVKFYEKGDRPLEFVTTRQWFTRTLCHKEALLEQGRKIEWHPAYMRARYENWVQGLNADWCISRQRFFGIPFPVWYSINKDGEIDYSKPIFAKTESLPVDPYTDTAPGYKEESRNKPGGFIGDPDVMDTWATSALSPQIQSHWLLDPKKHQKLFPMDIRPQGHDIIRTWAFVTIVKAWMHEREIPWKHIVLSGWILDPDRKKMSKSKGNVVTPGHFLDEHSADAVRYWASRARLGTDTTFDPTMFKIGGKLCIKLFNVSRFVLMQLGTAQPKLDEITHPLDKAVVSILKETITAATKEYKDFEYAGALQVAEENFWNFCDHYVELVKGRSYVEGDSPEKRSAQATLFWGLKTYLRLFAPFLPYITEEVWDWRFKGEGRDSSVHTTAWPNINEVGEIVGDPEAFNIALKVIGEVRGAKTAAQKGQRWGVDSLSVSGSKKDLERLQSVMDDLIHAGSIKETGITLTESVNEASTNIGVEVVLSSENT